MLCREIMKPPLTCGESDPVEKAARLLKPGGRFIALVTNLDSVQGRLLRADDYPRHLTLFTKRAVRDLSARVGLQVNEIWTDQKIFGGAMNGGLVYLLKRMGGYSSDAAFGEWKQADDPLRFWCQWHGSPSSIVLNVSRFDRAITWVRQQKALAPDKPFFLYYAPGATHAPHHVPKEWIDKFKGQFDQGWDKIREETFAQQR